MLGGGLTLWKYAVRMQIHTDAVWPTANPMRLMPWFPVSRSTSNLQRNLSVDKLAEVAYHQQLKKDGSRGDDKPHAGG